MLRVTELLEINNFPTLVRWLAKLWDYGILGQRRSVPSHGPLNSTEYCHSVRCSPIIHSLDLMKGRV